MVQFPDVKWPAEYTELTRIEELLHCKICYEYIETSVITPCSHNYCSICIRKFLNYKTQCPICFENIYEKDLHANRILDEFMESYLSLREKLFTCIKGVEIKERRRDDGDNNLGNVTPAKSNTPKAIKSSQSSIKTPKRLYNDNKTSPSLTNNGFNTPKESPRIKQLLITPNKYISGSSNVEKNTLRTNNSLMLGAKNEEEKIKNLNTNRKRVPCPVCSTEISEIYINKHLDDCLKRQNSMSPPKTMKNNLEPMPKYVINLMKDSELRKLLKKWGLSSSGVRKELEKRLQKFSTLYNVERDKLVPKSIADIVKICDEEEIAEKNLIKQSSSDHMPNINRKTDLSVIEKAHKQYLERNKDDYLKLIESINCREKERNKPVRSLFGLKTNDDSIATTSSASQTSRLSFLNQSEENNETNSSVADMSQFYPQDSDSTNASYPLQHYSRDDPMRFLALEVSSTTIDSPIKSEILSPRLDEEPINWKIKSANSHESRNSSNTMNLSNRSLNSPVFSLSSKNSPIKSEALPPSLDEEPIAWKIKSESPERSKKSSSDAMALSKRSLRSPVFSLSSENSEKSFVDQNETNASNIDIFDASTEDNWSEDNRSKGSGVNNKSKKKFVMKRSKLEVNNRSTDSETDVESTSSRFTGKKMKKKLKHGGKNTIEKINETDNGKGKGEIISPEDYQTGISNRSNFGNKENSELNDTEITNTRRSSRKRNHVSSYAIILRGKKPLVETNAGLENFNENQIVQICPDVCNEVDENNDEAVNASTRTLRKRRKR